MRGDGRTDRVARQVALNPPSNFHNQPISGISTKPGTTIDIPDITSTFGIVP